MASFSSDEIKGWHKWEGWVASASLPGTCGELVQGSLDGLPCLVSCPIDRYSRAHVRIHNHLTGWKTPVQASKALAALNLAIKRLGWPAAGGELSLASDLPRARGYASSTADIGAALFALSRACQVVLSPAEAARLAVAIEPTDSTLFPGLALFNHRDGGFFEALAPAPRLDLIVIDPGGAVDTQIYHQFEPRAVLRRLAPQHRTAFSMLRDGLAKHDLQAVGEAASLSARLHQDILFNPLLDRTFVLARRLHALGVCRAHSGTILGLLFDPLKQDSEDALRETRCCFPPAVFISRQKMVNGGPTYHEPLDYSFPSGQVVNLAASCEER